jgi:hypothetical protein
MKKVALCVTSLISLFAATTVFADNNYLSREPANKVAIAGSNESEILDLSCLNSAGNCQDNKIVSILKDTIRTADKSDLTISVSTECATTLTANEEILVTDFLLQNAVKAKVWVEVDGTPVPVALNDDGKVNFCNRVVEINSGVGLTAQATNIQLLDQAGGAHAFTWGTFHLKRGKHTVEVKAELDANVFTSSNLSFPEDTTAQVLLGRRTMIITPVNTHRRDDF